MTKYITKTACKMKKNYSINMKIPDAHLYMVRNMCIFSEKSMHPFL